MKLLRESRAAGSGGHPLTQLEWNAHMDSIARRAAELERDDAPASEFSWITESEKESV
ncbi:hypothetical protein ABZX72_03530 [Streptomyces cyaneofuscatus]|uniref:hypothetical protein n=1 Tax=Streptomyces cyaneofuscatus TaxID=66883 RepID=UPI0033A7D3EC